MDLPSHIKKPKLCSLRKWENYAGYGFNLHSEKGKKGQFIGKVDPNSPADLGGLNIYDVLIEVNGINVEDASHNIVVGRVKSIPDRVDLFVCDKETYSYCKENDIKLSSAMHNIDEHSTPARQPPVEERKKSSSPEAASSTSVDAAASLRAAVEQSGGVDYMYEEVKPSDLPQRFRSEEPNGQRESDRSSKTATPPPSFSAAAAPVAAAAAVAAPAAAAAPTSSASPPAYPTPQQQQQQQPKSQPPPKEQQQQQKQKSNGGDPVGDVSLEEVRSRIGQNKRNQVKMNSGTFSEKYSMFESL
ncbi:hypothetical protein BOX15_Mlig029045g1 [Macrostomum lignano]|uniref:Uncharacterized protein n=2 Tax=Macrostomum lignano TaxID=282301 RepID=A0A267EKK5_9PLAT|nr:hypothetical protein BOX15_Mlig029045g1 [Macrostomum lignano]